MLPTFIRGVSLHVANFHPRCFLHVANFHPRCFLHVANFDPRCFLHVANFDPRCFLHVVIFHPRCFLHVVIFHTRCFLHVVIFDPRCFLHVCHHPLHFLFFNLQALPLFYPRVLYMLPTSSSSVAIFLGSALRRPVSGEVLAGAEIPGVDRQDREAIP